MKINKNNKMLNDNQPKNTGEMTQKEIEDFMQSSIKIKDEVTGFTMFLPKDDSLTPEEDLKRQEEVKMKQRADGYWNMC